MTGAPRIPVLMYHRLGDARTEWESRYTVAPGGFAAHMRALRDDGYQAIAIDALVEWLDGGPALPDGAFLVTFDDGFRGVREHALPVLETLGWPCAVFLVSDLIGGVDEWTRASNPAGATYPLLDAGDIHDMQERGVSFHSHGRRHVSLLALGDAELAGELADSRTALAELLARDVTYVAYPFGHVDDRVEAATRAAGYRAAFSTQPGFNRRDVDRFRVRRIEVFGTDTPPMLLRKIRLGTNDGSLANLARYYARRVFQSA